jgi:hypothetical protein
MESRARCVMQSPHLRVMEQSGLTDTFSSCYSHALTITPTPRRSVMAARAKKSRRKSGGKSASKRTAGKRRAASAKRSGKKARPAKRGAASRKSSAKRPAIKKRAAKRPAIKKSAVKRSGAKRSASGGQKTATASPIARVTRVAKEVAQQASSAVTGGIETVKEFGGSIVERVTGENVSS